MPRVLLAVILPVLVVVDLAGAARIDLEADPQRMEPDAPLARRAWRNLFSVAPTPPAHDVAWCLQAEGGVHLLAARLRYTGVAWARHPGDESPTPSRWRERDREIKGAVLRELRYAADAGLVPVYRAFLAEETRPQLVVSAWYNLRHLDPAAALSLGLRLADPSVAGPLPGSRDGRLRRMVLALLAAEHGVDHRGVRETIAYALLQATGGERLAALRLVPRGGLDALQGKALLRLLDQHQDHPLSGDDRMALITAMDRCRQLDGELCARAVGLVLKEERDLACAAATMLRRCHHSPDPVLLGAIADRAGTTDDRAVLHALLALLLQKDPALAVRTAGLTSPWTVLGRHRQALEDWD